MLKVPATTRSTKRKTVEMCAIAFLGELYSKIKTKDFGLPSGAYLEDSGKWATYTCPDYGADYVTEIRPASNDETEIHNAILTLTKATRKAAI